MSFNGKFHKVVFSFEVAPSVYLLRIGFVLALFFVVIAVRDYFRIASQPSANPSISLSTMLNRRSIIVDVESIHWIDPPMTTPFGLFRRSRVVFLGRKGEGEPRDLYFAKVAISFGQRVSAVQLWNISGTEACSEDGFWARAAVVVTSCRKDGKFINLSFFDFSGRGGSSGLCFFDRVKSSISDYLEFGSFGGVKRAYLEFSTPQDSVMVEFKRSGIEVFLGQAGFYVSLDRKGFELVTSSVVGDVQAVDFHRLERVPTGWVAWVVDTLRSTELVGKEKIGWAESRWYRLVDFARRVFYKFAGQSFAARSIEQKIGIEGNQSNQSKRIEEYLTGLSDGLPPPPPPPDIPVLKEFKPIRGEGRWKPFSEPAFTIIPDGLPPPLYTTFIRVDPERPYSFANLVAWNPAQVELHVVAGAVEPISDTGRAGTGLIPRDDDTMNNLLAGFNGGFQALHGEFGLMQDGKVYLPPKPWAATVALLRGGRIGFGTWPGPETGQVPPEIVSYRQNLTPLIQDSVINPYKRHWWGSSPDLNPDSPVIARSGICWSNSGHVLYSLAYSVNEYTFAEAMKRAGCHYLIQLDVNVVHSGFEYIRVSPKSAPPALDRALDKKWEAEGVVRGRKDLIFRAKKLFRNMSMMKFPRYIKRNGRDFFYLRLVENLPGEKIVPPSNDWEVDGWRVVEQEVRQFPPSYVIATVRIPPRQVVKIVKIDLRWTELLRGHQYDAGTSGVREGIRIVVPESDSTNHLVKFGYDETGKQWTFCREECEHNSGKNIVLKLSPCEWNSPQLVAAMGFCKNRFLFWVEGEFATGEVLRQVLISAGAQILIPICRLDDKDAFGELFRISEGVKEFIPFAAGAKKKAGEKSLVFIRADRQGVVRLFPDTKVVLPRVWNPAQIKRIRYFRPEPDASTTGDANIMEEDVN